jgi:hypothetical protein
MTTLFDKYIELQSQIIKQYHFYIGELRNVKFYDEVVGDVDEFIDDLQDVSITNRYGTNVDLRILEISLEKGILVAEYEEPSNQYWVTLTSLMDIHQMIYIVISLENIYNEKLLN